MAQDNKRQRLHAQDKTAQRRRPKCQTKTIKTKTRTKTRHKTKSQDQDNNRPRTSKTKATCKLGILPLNSFFVRQRGHFLSRLCVQEKKRCVKARKMREHDKRTQDNAKDTKGNTTGNTPLHTTTKASTIQQKRRKGKRKKENLRECKATRGKTREEKER